MTRLEQRGLIRDFRRRLFKPFGTQLPSGSLPDAQFVRLVQDTLAENKKPAPAGEQGDGR